MDWDRHGTFTGTGATTETDSTARPANTYLNVTSGDETEVIHSSLSYRGPSSASLLGDSHDSIDNSDSTSTRSYLSRTREVVRRRRLSSRYSSHRTRIRRTKKPESQGQLQRLYWYWDQHFGELLLHHLAHSHQNLLVLRTIDRLSRSRRRPQ
jgi:hypothetical protein